MPAAACTGPSPPPQPVRRRARVPPTPEPAQDGGPAAAAQPVPFHAPWVLSATRAASTPPAQRPRNEAAQAAREGLWLLQRGAGGGGGRLP